MQITLKPHPSGQSRFILYLDGEPWRDLHTAIFGRKPQLPEFARSLEEFKEHFAELEYQLAKKYAFKRLARQPMLSVALSRAMKERLISEQVIEKVIQESLSLGFLNDSEWTSSFVRGRSGRYGPRSIAQKLASKGIRGEELEEALKGEWDREKQKKCVTHLLQTRYGKRNLSVYKEKQKVIASLIRKGFDLSIIIDSLNSK